MLSRILKLLYQAGFVILDVKLIVITKPLIFEGEAKQIMKLLNSSVDFVHVRKPNTSSYAVAQLLEEIPTAYHTKIKVHYYKDLLKKFPLVDFHHSTGSNSVDGASTRNQSKSTHRLHDLKKRGDFQYQFISPVFDSISKIGYKSKFSLPILDNYLKENNIKNAVALGGIEARNIQLVASLPLYGVALLGAAWDESLEANMHSIERIKKQLT